MGTRLPPPPPPPPFPPTIWVTSDARWPQTWKGLAGYVNKKKPRIQLEPNFRLQKLMLCLWQKKIQDTRALGTNEVLYYIGNFGENDKSCCPMIAWSQKQHSGIHFELLIKRFVLLCQMLDKCLYNQIWYGTCQTNNYGTQTKIGKNPEYHTVELKTKSRIRVNRMNLFVVFKRFWNINCGQLLSLVLRIRWGNSRKMNRILYNNTRSSHGCFNRGSKVVAN